VSLLVTERMYIHPADILKTILYGRLVSLYTAKHDTTVPICALLDAQITQHTRENRNPNVAVTSQRLRTPLTGTL
jgi:hypothetical protein